MATSGSANWGLTRDEIIKLAYQRMDVIGDGETPSTDQYTKAATVLNGIVKEWQGDGMPLWKISTFSFTPVASTGSYSIAVGATTIARYPPLKILQAWYRDNATYPNDTPLQLVTKADYNLLTPKTQEGTPVNIWYDPPGNQGRTSVEPAGTLYLWPEPSAAFVASNTIYLVGQFMFEDFDASGDYPDFPSNFNNALAWALADEMSLGEGVPSGKVAQIEKRAARSKQAALNNGPEEGSLFLQPMRRR